jgi:hypothetical protein
MGLKHLNEARLASYQLLRALMGAAPLTGEPTELMWIGYEHALMHYYNALAKEWKSRGQTHRLPLMPVGLAYLTPAWSGRKELHRAHQSQLLREDFKQYRSQFHRTPMNLPMYWPVKETPCLSSVGPHAHAPSVA